MVSISRNFGLRNLWVHGGMMDVWSRPSEKMGDFEPRVLDIHHLSLVNMLGIFTNIFGYLQ